MLPQQAITSCHIHSCKYKKSAREFSSTKQAAIKIIIKNCQANKIK